MTVPRWSGSQSSSTTPCMQCQWKISQLVLIFFGVGRSVIFFIFLCPFSTGMNHGYTRQNTVDGVCTTTYCCECLTEAVNQLGSTLDLKYMEKFKPYSFYEWRNLAGRTQKHTCRDFLRIGKATCDHNWIWWHQQSRGRTCFGLHQQDEQDAVPGTIRWLSAVYHFEWNLPLLRSKVVNEC